MKFQRLITKVVLTLALSSWCVIANAGLMLAISDLGAGQTRWQFSGSTTAVAASNDYNSFWGLWNGGNPIVDGTGTITGSIFAGGGIMSTTSGGIYSMDGIGAEDGTEILSARNFTTNLSWGAGDVLAWDGDIVTDIDFANLHTGTYTTLDILGTAITDTYTLQIGSAAGDAPGKVPEPATLALFGLGLAGVGWAKRKKS